MSGYAALCLFAISKLHPLSFTLSKSGSGRSEKPYLLLAMATYAFTSLKAECVTFRSVESYSISYREQDQCVHLKQSANFVCRAKVDMFTKY